MVPLSVGRILSSATRRSRLSKNLAFSDWPELLRHDWSPIRSCLPAPPPPPLLPPLRCPPCFRSPRLRFNTGGPLSRGLLEGISSSIRAAVSGRRPIAPCLEG